jgi:hypothetical protein
MPDVILRKESTSELYAKASISSGPVSTCNSSYNPLSINESFQIGTFSIKVQYRATFTSNDIVYDWKVIGQPTITRDDNLSPTIKSYYDSNRDGSSPAMSSELNTEIQSQLKEHEISQETAIKKQIRDYYDQSMCLAARSQVGANEIIAIFAAKRKMRYTRSEYTPITITGKIMIKPQIITAATKEDFAEMTYNSGGGTQTKTCATAQILLANTLDNFKFRLNNVVDSTGDLDMGPYNNFSNWGDGALSSLLSNASSRTSEMNARKTKQLTLMEEYAQTAGDYARYSRWLREWQNNQRTTITNESNGFFKFGLSGAAAGVFNIKMIIPFGEGGLYWNSATVVLNLNVNQLTSEIGFWQQYAARVREYENNYNAALAAYLAGLKTQIPPETSTTDLNLLPLEDFGTILPQNPEINQSPQAPGTGGRDVIPLDPTPDLSPFFPGPTPPFIDIFDLPPLGMNGGINGFFKA